MAIIITKEMIEIDNKLRHYKDTRTAAKNLVEVLKNYLDGKTTRSQLNKALKKVEYLTANDIL